MAGPYRLAASVESSPTSHLRARRDGFVQSGLREVALPDARPARRRPHITLQISRID